MVDNIDKAKSTEHIMMMTDNVPGTKVGLGDVQGISSAVENSTLKNGSFDEVASHELGHNLGLNHSQTGLMKETASNGQFGLAPGQLKQIYGGAAVLPTGTTKLYYDPIIERMGRSFGKMKILNRKIDTVFLLWPFAAFSITITSCSDGDKFERRSLSGFSVGYPNSWTLDTGGVKSIDTDIGRIITDDNDTIVYEYGKGIYKIMESPKTIVPVAQKHYWDSVGLSSEVILSSTPKEDISLNIHAREYYLKDTIDNKEVIWVFPKKFRKGKTGAYFFNPRGKNLSIYSNTIHEGTVNDFIEVVKSIKFDK